MKDNRLNEKRQLLREIKEERKRKKKEKEKKYKSEYDVRIIKVGIVTSAVVFALIFRLGYIQLIQGASLKEMMYNQLTTNRIISPKRGTIYDATGKALAISAQVDTVSINSASIIVKHSDEDVQELKTKELKENVATVLSEIFELDYEETLEKVQSESTSAQIIARKVEQDKVDELTVWMNENEVYSGINIDEDTKRFYPYESLASSLLGFTGTDNQGLYGIETYWNDVLTGVTGKIVSSQNATLDLIPDENTKYYSAQNGNDITLTIDANIQSIAEKYLKQACEENLCDEGGNIIIMQPDTGDILAMATYPDFDLNTPFSPTHLETEEWDEMNFEDQNDVLLNLWNNRALTYTYEPGSVYKIITAAIGLEEGLADSDTHNAFTCPGYQEVGGVRISCSTSAGHGDISLRQALQYSCNPAFIQLGQDIGAELSYKYYDAFGFFNTTNFDSIGERTGYYWNVGNVGSVELATMSFGQRFRITPIQMITAVCSVANDGVLMKPRIVKEIKNTDTQAVTTIETEEVRQVVSKETANSLMDMLKTVVDDGTGKYAQLKYYSIAGKTGTSEPDPNDENQNYVASFVGITPVENPEIVVLVTLYGPKAGATGGGAIAAPVGRQILEEVLPYLEIPSDVNVDADDIELIDLPNIENKTVAEAKKILDNAGFQCVVYGEDEDIVIDQIPKEGSSLVEDSIIIVYTQNDYTKVSQTVPNLKGLTLTEAKAVLKSRNLNIYPRGSGTVITQDIIAGETVEEGTVIKINLDSEIVE